MKIISEHVPYLEHETIKVSVFENEEIDLSYPFHSHKNAFELTFTMGLSGTRMVGDSTEQFFGNDLVLMAPGLPHCWYDHGIEKNSGGKIVVIQFLDESFADSLLKFRDFANIKWSLENAVYGLESIGNHKARLFDQIKNVDLKNIFEVYLFLLKCLHRFGEKNACKKLCTQGYAMPVTNSETKRLEVVLKYIQKNYTRKLPISEVAEQVYMSPSAFSHYFKKRTLKSFVNYLMELRLGKAAQMLQHSELPISQICHESGFQNISHFNRSFLKQYGTTPLKFRKQSILL